jgi:hypothetical protein
MMVHVEANSKSSSCSKHISPCLALADLTLIGESYSEKKNQKRRKIVRVVFHTVLFDQGGTLSIHWDQKMSKAGALGVNGTCLLKQHVVSVNMYAEKALKIIRKACTKHLSDRGSATEHINVTNQVMPILADSPAWMECLYRLRERVKDNGMQLLFDGHSIIVNFQGLSYPLEDGKQGLSRLEDCFYPRYLQEEEIAEPMATVIFQRYLKRWVGLSWKFEFTMVQYSIPCTGDYLRRFYELFSETFQSTAGYTKSNRRGAYEWLSFLRRQVIPRLHEKIEEKLCTAVTGAALRTWPDWELARRLRIDWIHIGFLLFPIKRPMYLAQWPKTVILPTYHYVANAWDAEPFCCNTFL